MAYFSQAVRLVSYSLLLFLIIHCKPRYTGTSAMTQPISIQNQDAELTILRIQITDSAITITYQIRNRTARNLYVFNKLYDTISPDMLLEVDKNSVNIDVSNEQVFISKAMAKVPANKKVEYESIPCVTKIGPLSDVEETFTVPLPLTPRTPYLHPDISETTTAKTLFFSIGYFVGHSLTESYEVMVKTPDGPAIHFDPFSYQDQKLLTVGPLAQAVPVFEPK